MPRWLSFAIERTPSLLRYPRESIIQMAPDML